MSIQNYLDLYSGFPDWSRKGGRRHSVSTFWRNEHARASLLPRQELPFLCELCSSRGLICRRHLWRVCLHPPAPHCFGDWFLFLCCSMKTSSLEQRDHKLNSRFSEFAISWNCTQWYWFLFWPVWHVSRLQRHLSLSAERPGSLGTRNTWLQRKMIWLVKFMNWHFHYFRVGFPLPENVQWLTLIKSPTGRQ